jgi:phosphatidylglycerophosphate synthase
MIDGLMAVEGGLRTKCGALFNEIPDRVSDTLLMVGAGYAAEGGNLGIQLGWAAAFFAILTAYIRTLGGAQGIEQDFCGPMAKQQRMLILAIACLVASLDSALNFDSHAILIALGTIVAGACFTAIRRTYRLANHLEKKII